MNITIINHYAGSDYHGMEFRPYYMGREWVKMGHNVTIVAATFSHLRKNNPEVNKDLQEEIIDGIKYVWIKTPKYKGNGVGRILNIAIFMAKMRLYYKKIADKYNPDAVIASSTYPLDIYPTHRISKRVNAKMCFEIHDLWPLTPMEIGGYSEKNPIIVMLQRAEDFAYRNSDKIISILPCADKHIKNRGFSTDRYVHIPNGVIINNESTNEVPDEIQIDELQKLKDEGYSLIGYTGNHSPANSLDTFIDAAKLCENDKVKFVLVGSGNAKNQLIDYANKKSISNVVFLDPIRKENMSKLLEKLDIAYIGLRKEKLFSYGVSPNKLFDYMIAKKAIIYSVEAGNDPVRDSKCGITVPAEDSNAVADAVRRLLNVSDEERNEMGLKGYDYVVTNHEYSHLAEMFVNALK